MSVVESGDRATAIDMIRAHADVHVRDADGTTALHWAAHESDTELTRLLIAAGADVRAVNDYGASPLSAAAENGDAHMIELLLKAGADAGLHNQDRVDALDTARRRHLTGITALLGNQ